MGNWLFMFEKKLRKDKRELLIAVGRVSAEISAVIRQRVAAATRGEEVVKP